MTFMDFRLRVFVEVATHLSFTKAANVLEISQPAISKHIQELEASFNVKLLLSMVMVTLPFIT